MTGDSDGRLLAGPKTQADSATTLTCLLVVVQPSALRGVRHAVEEHAHAQHVPIKGQGFVHVPGANGDMGYCRGFHRLRSSIVHLVVGVYAGARGLPVPTVWCWSH